jgi:hypothetical protein
LRVNSVRSFLLGHVTDPRDVASPPSILSIRGSQEPSYPSIYRSPQSLEPRAVSAWLVTLDLARRGRGRGPAGGVWPGSEAVIVVAGTTYGRVFLWFLIDLRAWRTIFFLFPWIWFDPPVVVLKCWFLFLRLCYYHRSRGVGSRR